jgi:hypothetical protein
MEVGKVRWKKEVWLVTSPKYVELLLKLGVRKFMFNFYYDHDIDKLKEAFRKIKENGGKIWIDSGGLQLLNAWKEGELPKNFDFDEYFRNFTEFLVELWEYVDWFSELDIDAIVGYNKVQEWRDLIKKNNLDEKCVWIWHGSMPNAMDEWRSMCKQRKFNAIGFAEEKTTRRATSNGTREIEVFQIKPLLPLIPFLVMRLFITRNWQSFNPLKGSDLLNVRAEKRNLNTIS